MEYQAVPTSDGYMRGFALCARYGDEWASVPEAAHLIFRSEAEAMAFAEAIEDDERFLFYYRDFTIFAPIPEARQPDWGFADNDGHGGIGRNAADCGLQIDAFYEAREGGSERRSEPLDLSDDRDALASAGFVEGE